MYHRNCTHCYIIWRPATTLTSLVVCVLPSAAYADTEPCRYRTLRRGRCASWTSAHMPLASCWRRRSTRLPCSSNPPRWQSSSSRTSTSKKRVPAAASTAARPQSCPPFPYNSSSSARWLVFPYNPASLSSSLYVRSLAIPRWSSDSSILGPYSTSPAHTSTSCNYDIPKKWTYISVWSHPDAALTQP